MKKQILCLFLLLSLGLTGCASMLQQTYVSVTPHDRQPAAEVDNSAIRVEDYPQLVSAILYLVSQGEEEGVIRLHNNYKPDVHAVQADLAAACDEVWREDPLGAYAVDGIKPSAAKRIVSYYESTVTITYRRTPEQIAAIVPVTGSGAIRTELGDTLTAFAPEVALRVNYFSNDSDYIKALVRRAYYDSPAAAQGMPQVAVSLYPETGLQHIVEVVLVYGQPAEALEKKRDAAEAAAQALVPAPVRWPESVEGLVEVLFTALRGVSDGGGDSPTSHAALVSGDADCEGMALGFKLLCDLAGVECLVAQGTDADGAPHFWTVVTVGDEHRHVDPSSPDGLLLTDQTLVDQGFQWDRGSYPPCGPPVVEAVADVVLGAE